MLLNISYTEIQDLIKQKVQKDIRLSAIDNRTFCVSADISIPLLGLRTITVQLRLEELCNDYVLLSYNNGFGVDLAITGVMKFLEMRSAVPYIEGLPNERIKIYLCKIPQLKSALDAIVLQELLFSGTNALVTFKMRK